MNYLHPTPLIHLIINEGNGMGSVLIKKGFIYDGTGKSPYKGDIAIKERKIVAIGKNLDETGADIVINAEGLCVSPGFIDPHTHNDLIFAYDKENTNGLTQGVTTQIVGLCGLGPVPMREEDKERGMYLYSGIFGSHSFRASEWSGLTDYMSKIKNARINVAVAISHCALRIFCAGYGDVPYDEKLAVDMQTVLDGLLKEGAIGFSTGLDYYPARLSKTKELIDLCHVVKKNNGIFLIHTRPFADEYTPMEEVFKIAGDTKVKTHVLHTKTYYPDTYGKPEVILNQFQRAIEEGCDITSEFYPYSAFASYVMSFLPSWVMGGDFDAVMNRLKDEKIRARLVEGTWKGYNDFMIGATPARFTDVGGHPEYEGKTFEEVADLRQQSVGEMIVDVLHEARLQVCMMASEPDEDKVRAILQDDFMKLLESPIYTVASDSLDAGSKPHPRACGTFSKILRLAREYGYPLEKLIYKLTYFNAERFSITDRGVLAKGKAADITVFDYSKVCDRATYEHPRKQAEGIEYVIVNGEVAVKNGNPTEKYAGEVLRHKR